LKQKVGKGGFLIKNRVFLIKKQRFCVFFACFWGFWLADENILRREFAPEISCKKWGLVV